MKKNIYKIHNLPSTVWALGGVLLELARGTSELSENNNSDIDNKNNFGINNDFVGAGVGFGCCDLCWLLPDLIDLFRSVWSLSVNDLSSIIDLQVVAANWVANNLLSTMSLPLAPQPPDDWSIFSIWPLASVNSCRLIFDAVLFRLIIGSIDCRWLDKYFPSCASSFMRWLQVHLTCTIFPGFLSRHLTKFKFYSTLSLPLFKSLCSLQQLTNLDSVSSNSLNKSVIYDRLWWFWSIFLVPPVVCGRPFGVANSLDLAIHTRWHATLALAIRFNSNGPISTETELNCSPLPSGGKTN